MNKPVFGASCVALVALVMSVASASAQADPRSVLPQTFDPSSGAILVETGVDLSLRSHDDWPLVMRVAQPSLDLSPRSHDDWAVGPR